MNLPRRPLEAMATAPITRHFLGFEEPALESAARYLTGLAPPMADRTLDLSETVVVVPGARAGRQFRNRLLLGSESLDKGLLPPRIVTTSHLPELLYEPRRPFASRWIQQLAWTTALARVGPTIRRRIAPRLTAESQQGSGSLSEDWLDVGRMLWRQYRELTAEGLSFADVVEQVESLEGFRETQRWTALAAVQNEYLQALDSEEIWDKQTARLVAIRHEECRFDGHLVLLGAVDLSRTMKEMLSQVAASVTALIFAPPTWESRFDLFGCVDVNAWEAAEVPIPASSWQVAYGPQEQAQQIVDVIREFDGEYAPHEVVVGCADAKLVPFVQRSLSEQEVGSRWSAGEPIEQTGPAKLVSALAELLNGERFASFAAWLRHPDVLRWLAAQRIFPLAAVDKYYNDYLPATWSEDFRGKADSMAESTFTACHGLLAGLRGPDQPIAKWMPIIREVLHTIYRQQSVPLDRESSRVRLDACQGIDEAIGSMSALPARLSFDVSASLALQLVGAAMAGERVGVPQTEDGIELLGWLELPLDAAPALIVTGFNEGLVPQSVTSDLFLPDRLRQHLEIHDNRQRYARDAYTLSVLLASRRSLHLISCQHDVHGDPLLPSRLLFCCDEQHRAARMLQFSEATTSVIEPNAPDPAISPLITTPLPDEEVPLPDSINVTDFKRYLRCPYQYYLERVLRLDRIDDQAQELVAHRFGTLIHTALERFGRSAAKDLGASHEIYRAVEQELRGAAQAFFGFEPLPVVGVQVEQAMSRLKAFARQQALLRADGWEIVHVEEEGMDAMVEVEWMVDDHPFTIRGKIDRIDRHAESGAVRIIDYKTGAKGVDIRKLKDDHG
ncbi:MAG: PD-(D/E)XK nuclease family protein, partial [Planctomycetota bacterium]